MKIRALFIVFVMFFSSSLFAESAKDIFDRFCTVCHSPSMAPMFNSPAAHDINAWNDRKESVFNRSIEQDGSLKNISGSEKDEHCINELVKSAILGTDKGMPPKGTCSDCTDDELKSVITFMSSAG